MELDATARCLGADDESACIAPICAGCTRLLVAGPDGVMPAAQRCYVTPPARRDNRGEWQCSERRAEVRRDA